jgi:protein-L-isoaspartate(D-aspartate) O-methyltransferase
MGDRELARSLVARGIRDRRVIAAIEHIDRSQFVPEHLRAQAGQDAPLPIGHEQTISQPYVVAFMSEALGLRGEERVLEIGTGSGYQTAVLAHLAAEVYSIELVPQLAEAARARLVDQMGFLNLRLRRGDGYLGWPEAAPFDAIVLTAAPERIPERLVEQLAEGGVLVAPVGPFTEYQELVKLVKSERGPVVTRLLPVRFVPMVPGAPEPS